MGVKVNVKTIKDDFYRIEKSVVGVGDKTVNVGILGGGEQAYIAAIHEYGCKIKITPKMRVWLHANGLPVKDTTTHITIPERSFLRNGFDATNEEVLKKADKAIKSMIGGKMDSDAFLEMIGITLSSKIKKYARDLDTPPNHPFTIDHKKGKTNPLVNTGDMIGAITYEVT